MHLNVKLLYKIREYEQKKTSASVSIKKTNKQTKKTTVPIVRKTKGREDTEHRKRDPLASLKCFYLSQKKHDMVFWLILTLRAMLSIH